MKRILFIGLGLIVGFAALVLIINQLDQPLKPEVAKILNQTLQTNDTQKQAYAFLKEHYAAFKRVSSPDCGKSICGSKALKEFPKLKATLKENSKVTADYIRLLEFGDIAPDYQPSTPEQPIEQVLLAPPNMHHYFLLQLAEWRARGGGARVLDLIEISNRYMKAAMSHGSLLDRTIGVLNMRRNVEFLEAEFKIEPRLKNLITPELVSSFSTPDVNEIMSGAMDNELRVLNAFVHVISRKEFDIDPESTNAWEDLAMQVEKLLHSRLFLRPNQTLNEFYTLVSESLATDCPMVEEGAEKNCLPSWPYLTSTLPWNAVVNPTGKYLVKITGGGYVFRKKKIQMNIAQIYEFRKSISP